MCEENPKLYLALRASTTHISLAKHARIYKYCRVIAAMFQRGRPCHLARSRTAKVRQAISYFFTATAPHHMARRHQVLYRERTQCYRRRRHQNIVRIRDLSCTARSGWPCHPARSRVADVPNPFIYGRPRPPTLALTRPG